MKINIKQLLVILIAVSLFIISELFHPWLYEDGSNSAKRSAGYHFINGSPPKVKSETEMRKLFLIQEDEPPHYFTVQKDFARLYSQRIAIPLLMIGFFFLLSYRKSYVKVGISIGLILIGLLFTYLVFKMTWSVTH